MKQNNTGDTASDSDRVCPKCGAEVSDQARICISCRAAVLVRPELAKTQDADDSSTAAVFFDARAAGGDTADSNEDAHGYGTLPLGTNSGVNGGTIVIDCGADDDDLPTNPPAGSIPGSVKKSLGQLIGASINVRVDLIEGCRVVMGRDHRTCDVVVTDSRVSREHCAISMVDGIAVLEDLHSTNGTFVSGVRVDGVTPLKTGDRIRLGRVELDFTSH